MQVRAIVGGEAGLGQGPVLHGSAQPPGGLMGPQANGPVMTSGHDPGLGPQQSNGGQGGGGGGGKQSKGKKTSTSRNNGYRAKELAEIKNGLQQFEKKAEAGRAAEARDSLRTVSSLSTESSTNSVCSDTGFSSVQEALHKLSNLGYDEVGDQNYVFNIYHKVILHALIRFLREKCKIQFIGCFVLIRLLKSLVMNVLLLQWQCHLSLL